MLVLAMAAGIFAAIAPASPAGAATTVTGAGSTWSSIAISQWRGDAALQGIPVQYTANGSSTGRQWYIQGTSDFGVSEIPFQKAYINREGQQIYDETAGAARRPYAYMPIVAGGTSFMYHLDVNGRQVNNLRLSGRTIAKIFTGLITNWNDPQIAKENGRAFPSIPITPVVRSDGSGTSAQFTAYMASMFPDIWNPFCTRATNIPAPCPATSLYPYFGRSKAQALSDGVSAYVDADYSNGSITYVEYGYARHRKPVVSVLNQAGYYVQPTAQNVAIALTRAHINRDRTQVLGDVYRNTDPRAYPVSSYSYMIVPTTTASPFSTAKGQTLGRFILYFLCTGQQKAEILGYSPLPPNLVQMGFEVVKLIPGAPTPPPLSRCANPTITGLFDPKKSPLPNANQRVGSNPVANGGGGGGGSGGQNVASGGAVTQSNSTDTTVAASADPTADAGVDPETGQPIDGENVRKVASPTSISRAQDDVSVGVYVIIVALILLVVFAPPALGLALRKRR